MVSDREFIILCLTLIICLVISLIVKSRKYALFVYLISVFLVIGISAFFILTPSYTDKVRGMDVNIELAQWSEQPEDAGYEGSYLDYYGVVQSKYKGTDESMWITLNNDVIAEIYCPKHYKSIETGTKIRVRGKCIEAGKQLVLLKSVLLDCNCD